MKKRYFVFPILFLVFIVTDCFLAIFDALFSPLFPLYICNTAYYHYFIRGGYYFFITMAVVYVLLEYKHIKTQEVLIYILSFLGILLLHIPFYILALSESSFPWDAILRVMYENDLLILFLLFAIGALVYISKLIYPNVLAYQPKQGLHQYTKIHKKYILYPLTYVVFIIIEYLYATNANQLIYTSLIISYIYSFLLTGIHMIFIGSLVTYIILRYQEISLKESLIFIGCFLVILLIHIPFSNKAISYTLEFDLPTIYLILIISIITSISIKVHQKMAH